MNKKILLVEDNPDYALALEIRLKSLGYALICADSMSAALSKIVSCKPDVSVIDINLPDGDGFNLAGQIKSNPNAPEIPVIFITANHDASYREKARFYSPIAFLEKPFNPRKLIDAIEQSQYSTTAFRAHYMARRA
ncbi:hypothetical protein AB833_09745 [Chromatiales bacterium (ex Bugula neritina AB1)]|nr:hypothetical protein AB833_09745 [Chromatiales bacterium (ex Bugula neritina AB1)]